MDVKEIYEQPMPPVAGYWVSLSTMEAVALTRELQAIESENLPAIQMLYRALKSRRP